VRGRGKATSGRSHSCVLLADRHHGLVEGMRGLLETAFEVVIMVADKLSLQDVAHRLHPDAAIVDLSLARDGNLEWLRDLRARCPALKVVVLSVHDEDSVRQAALGAGADEFVLKRSISTDLIPALERVRALTPSDPADDAPDAGSSRSTTIPPEGAGT
jgi:DNA-binding NarL/FixJ family response regulator